MKGRPTTGRFLTNRESHLLVNTLRAKGITGTQIANANGVKSTMITNAISGKYRITPKIIEMFNKAGIDLSKFMIDGE